MKKKVKSYSTLKKSLLSLLFFLLLIYLFSQWLVKVECGFFQSFLRCILYGYFSFFVFFIESQNQFLKLEKESGLEPLISPGLTVFFSFCLLYSNSIYTEAYAKFNSERKHIIDSSPNSESCAPLRFGLRPNLPLRGRLHIFAER